MKKIFKNKNKILILLIFLLALGLRVYKVTQYPAGLNADEAAIGYNAYSLLLTGKDEFGHSWPLNFQSFNDYKPGLYFYLTLPLIKILGLTVLAVRLPSVILGALTVLILYLSIKQIFQSDFWALISSFLLAVSPWSLHFSRGGWESNVATFFIVLGLYLFFLSLKTIKLLPVSAFSFVLAMFTYHSARLVVPFLVLGLIIFSWHEIFKKENFKQISLTGLIVGFSLIILLISMTGQSGISRFAGVGLAADKGPYWRTNELRGQHENPYSLAPKIIHNKYLEYSFRFIDNYLRHFSGDFLFISGDEIQRNRVPEMGQMYLIELPFLFLGLYFLVKNKQQNWLILFWWLAVSPLASALTFQSPHAIRSLNMAVPLAVITGYGLINFVSQIKKSVSRKLFSFCLSIFILLFIWNFAFYLHQYYLHYPRIYPGAWEYGFDQVVKYIQEKEGEYQQIFVTDKYDQPYILLAFFLRYPPADFQKEAKLSEKDQYGFSTVRKFDKYQFGAVNLKTIERGRKTLIVGTKEEIPDSATILKKIYFKDGRTEAFRITEQ